MRTLAAVKKAGALVKHSHVIAYKDIFDLNDVEDNSNQAAFILKNVDRMSDEERYILHKKICNKNRVYQDLLMFEMVHLQPHKVDKEELIKSAKYFLNRYRNTTHIFEDEWKMHNESSKKYPLSENDVCFDNSVTADNNYVTIIEKLVELLQRLTDDYTVRYREYYDEHDVLWIVVVFRYREHASDIKCDNTGNTQ